MIWSCFSSCWPSWRGGNHISSLRLVSSIFPRHFFNNWQSLTFIARYDGFPPYTSTKNETDTCVIPEGLPKSTLVIESGWSEPSTDLHRDRKMWLNWATTTEVVLILRWSRSYCFMLCRDPDYWNDWTASFQVLFSWLPPKVHRNEQPSYASENAQRYQTGEGGTKLWGVTFEAWMNYRTGAFCLQLNVGNQENYSLPVPGPKRRVSNPISSSLLFLKNILGHFTAVTKMISTAL